MKKRCYIVMIGILFLSLGYFWEKDQYKEKTYSYYKEERLSKKEAGVFSYKTSSMADIEEMDEETIERIGCVYSGFVLENAREIEEDMADGGGEKIAYLTFDDGPSKVTESVLDTLREYNVKATFFVVGNEIRKGREGYLKRMVKEGHAIGIHTYTHEYKRIYCSADAYVADVLRTSDKIKEVCGVKSSIYRFPWGSANCFIKGIYDDITDRLYSMNMVYHDWNVSADDSIGNPSAYSIKHNIEKDFKRFNQPVILMHDSDMNELTANILPEIIEMIQKEGYRFDTLLKRNKPYQYLNR